jgi:hypothetical protein
VRSIDDHVASGFPQARKAYLLQNTGFGEAAQPPLAFAPSPPYSFADVHGLGQKPQTRERHESIVVVTIDMRSTFGLRDSHVSICSHRCRIFARRIDRHRHFTCTGPAGKKFMFARNMCGELQQARHHQKLRQVLRA